MTIETASQKLSQDLRRRGALILAVFALVWAAAGTSGMMSVGVAWAVVMVLAVVLTVVIIILGVRFGSSSRPGRPRQLPSAWLRDVGRVNIIQVIAILAAVFILARIGSPTFIPPVICLIVGAHFLPLARYFGQQQYWWTGALLITVAAAGFVVLAVGDGGGTAQAVVGIGAAVVLWGTALHVATRG